MQLAPGAWALQEDDTAAYAREREGQLKEAPQGGNSASDDVVVLLPGRWIAGGLLRPPGDHFHRQRQFLRRHIEERRFASLCLEQRDPKVGAHEREWDPGKACAAADIDHLRGVPDAWAKTEEGVGDMNTSGLERIGDGRQAGRPSPLLDEVKIADETCGLFSCEGETNRRRLRPEAGGQCLRGHQVLSGWHRTSAEQRRHGGPAPRPG